MLEETELVKKLREIVWEADLCTTTAGIIRKKLEDHFGVDLSSKKQKRLINLQINSFLEEQLKTEALNEEVRGEARAQKEQKVETSEKVKVEGYRKMDVLKEEERGIGNGTKSCFQNLKDPSKGKETGRQSKEEEEEEEDATSKSKKAVEQPNRAREDEAPTKLKGREKQPNNRGEEAPSQSKETVVQLISAGEEEIPSKSKKSKRERQEEDMEKSEKPRKKPKRTKVEAPSKSKKPSKQPIQAEEGVAPKSNEAEKQHKEEEEEALLKTKEKESQPQTGTEEALLKTKEKESQPQTGTEAKSLPNDKDQKRAGSAFLDPLPISDALVKFLGTDETALSRTEAVKKIWIHIKQKKLQDCSDKQKVICDDKLKELFQVEYFSGFKVRKLLEPHFPQDGIV